MMTKHDYITLRDTDRAAALTAVDTMTASLTALDAAYAAHRSEPVQATVDALIASIGYDAAVATVATAVAAVAHDPRVTADAIRWAAQQDAGWDADLAASHCLRTKVHPANISLVAKAIASTPAPVAPSPEGSRHAAETVASDALPAAPTEQERETVRAAARALCEYNRPFLREGEVDESSELSVLTWYRDEMLRSCESYREGIRTDNSVSIFRANTAAIRTNTRLAAIADVLIAELIGNAPQSPANAPESVSADMDEESTVNAAETVLSANTDAAGSFASDTIAAPETLADALATLHKTAEDRAAGKPVMHRVGKYTGIRFDELVQADLTPEASDEVNALSSLLLEHFDALGVALDDALTEIAAAGYSANYSDTINTMTDMPIDYIAPHVRRWSGFTWTIDGATVVEFSFTEAVKSIRSRESDRTGVTAEREAKRAAKQAKREANAERIAAAKAAGRMDWVGQSLQGRGWMIKANERTQKIELSFDEFPTDRQRELVKAHNFAWHPASKLWCRGLKSKAWKEAMALGAELSAA